ncbi:hypothetical protein [Rossellomorea aquimaris]|uniref:Uncharacterized protein n=1 Tax=Rossellomorea aquimaris TaxID=189382 RepID=A0A366EUX1_9BACI|nr:hypothetical protein [Rossellomorea aquimaris]RBP06178.1 hypothetical protein DET59_103310 [Rossellomorea aquimaris]
MQVISLSSLLEVAEDENEIIHYLSSFKCEKNKDVESFLHSLAIPNENRAFTRTSLVVDDDQESEIEIIGYFTLLIKPFEITGEVSKESRRKLTGDKEAVVFNSILIAQLGRSDRYKGAISGEVILGLALENCELIFDLTGLRVCVEYDDIPYLNDFYIKNEFKILQINSNQKLLAFLRL